jgi:dTDP-4-amino-4,6-dideoxygalactose transaminase
MRDEFLVFGAPLIGEAEIAEVEDSLRSGWIGTGPKVERFERMLEAYIGAKHVRCVASCTAALMLSLETLGLRAGDEVLVPSMTFVATANAVEHTGATPVLIDSDPATGLIDLEAAEEALTPRTRAIVPVHLGGRPVDLERLNRFRDRHGLLVVEDAAHALGAEWGGRRIGAHGNVTAYSFYATKNVTTGEGGAVATDDPKIAEAIERLALHGLSQGAWQRFSDQGFRHYEAVTPGYKMNLTDLQASLGIHQLPRLDEWIARRAELSARYDELLAGLPLQLPTAAAPDTRHARHLYSVLLSPDAPVSRDQLLNLLHDHRIGAGVHYRAVHLHPYYSERYEIAPADLPVATDLSMRTLSLPLGPSVTEADQDDVADALSGGLG